MKLNKATISKMKLVLGGGKGSGHFGHAGRPGKVGGSSPSSSGSGWGDEHARKNVSIVPGKRKMPWEMTREEYESLTVVYRGVKQGAKEEGFAFFSNDPEIAKWHGAVREYRILPGAKIYPDPEVEGELDETLNGFQSLDNGSAVIDYDDVVRNFDYSVWKR